MSLSQTSDWQCEHFWRVLNFPWHLVPVPSSRVVWIYHHSYSQYFSLQALHVKSWLSIIRTIPIGENNLNLQLVSPDWDQFLDNHAFTYIMCRIHSLKCLGRLLKMPKNSACTALLPACELHWTDAFDACLHQISADFVFPFPSILAFFRPYRTLTCEQLSKRVLKYLCRKKSGLWVIYWHTI